MSRVSSLSVCNLREAESAPTNRCLLAKEIRCMRPRAVNNRSEWIIESFILLVLSLVRSLAFRSV